MTGSNPPVLDFATAPCIVMNAGAAAVLPAHVQALGLTRLMVDSDAGIQRAGLLQPVLAALASAGIAITVLYAVEPDPSESTVVEAIAVRKRRIATGCSASAAARWMSPIGPARQCPLFGPQPMSASGASRPGEHGRRFGPLRTFGRSASGRRDCQQRAVGAGPFPTSRTAGHGPFSRAASGAGPGSKRSGSDWKKPGPATAIPGRTPHQLPGLWSTSGASRPGIGCDARS